MGSSYGRGQFVYSVYGLIHLASDAKQFGTLDNISSFPFENFLQKLKKFLFLSLIFCHFFKFFANLKSMVLRN